MKNSKDKLRLSILKDFKLHGLTLEPQASKYLVTIFEKVDETKHDKVIRRLISSILNLNIESTKVSKEICEEAVSSCKTDRTDELNVVSLIDAYKTPQLIFSTDVKKFTLIPPGSPYNSEILFPNHALPKCFMHYHRYQVIYQRLLRNKLFKVSGKFKLSPIERLLACGGTLEDVIVLGLVIQSKDYRWNLEDPTGFVPLDLSNCQYHQGLFPEGSILILEGSYIDGVLVVSGLGLPPIEPASETLKYISCPDPLANVHTQVQLDKFQKTMTYTQAGVDAMVVILGETRLNQPDCIDRLSSLFSGFSSSPPLAFVLFGDFLTSESSYGINAQNITILEKLLRQLLQSFVSNFPDKKRMPQLVLIPGPNDPFVSPSQILPYASLRSDLIPSDFQDDIATNFADHNVSSKTSDSKHHRWLHLMSNPCRMRVFSRSVVLFRSEYNSKLINHCIHMPKLESSSDSNLTQHSRKDNDMSSLLGKSLVQCIASQSHLMPLPVYISPVYWSLDQSLHLHPLPDLVVCAEPNPLANINSADPVGLCTFINPERFGQLKSVNSCDDRDMDTQLKYDFTFKVWYPSSNTIEDSKLPDF